MSFEQWMNLLFVNHWFATTLLAPGLAVLYAWVTEQYVWFSCALVWAILLYGVTKT